MLIRLFNFIRQCFCRHDFLIEEYIVKKPRKIHSPDMFGILRSTGEVKYVESDYLVYMRCKKCGWHTKHLKRE